MNKNKKQEVSEAASKLGRLGGLSVVKKHGKEYMKKLAKKSLAVRRKKWAENKKGRSK